MKRVALAVGLLAIGFVPLSLTTGPIQPGLGELRRPY